VKYNGIFLFPYTFFNDTPTGHSHTGRRIFTRSGSNDAVSRKGVLFKGKKFKVNIYSLKNPPKVQKMEQKTDLEIFGQKRSCIKFSPTNGS